MSDPIELRAEGIELHRRGRTILRGVDVTVPAGRLAALTGPSGSGKTSLLTVLAAAETPDAGTVTWDGQAVTARSRDPWTGRVQLAHQSFGLLSLLTAAENVELALQGVPSHRRPKRRRIQDAAQEALDAVGLAARADNLVEDLSGGEQQRVSLARALVTDPDLLLADEPTAQLDPDTREQITGLLIARAHAGTTIIVATHDDELSARCAPLFKLRDGVIPAADQSG